MVILQRYFRFLVPTLYMGGGGSKQPAAPDPYKTADAQTQANMKQSAFDAKLNRYTQDSPLGTVSWQNLGTDQNPNYVQNTTLSPQQQHLYESQSGTQQELASQAADQALNLRRMLTTNDPQNGNLETRQHVEQGLMDRLNPYLQQDQNMLNTQLANQGLQAGGEAYTNAQRDMSKRVNDARLAVIAQGGQEMANTQNMNNAARNQSLQELNAYMQGSGNVNLPAYGGGTVISGGQTPDIAGLINSQYQTQVANANAGQAGKNGLLGGGLGALGTIGGSLAGRK